MGLVTAGTMVANVAAYVLHVPASRWLGLDGYSEFASLLGLQLLLAVPGLALQTVVARDVVRGESSGRVRALQIRCAAIVAVVAIVLVPVVVEVLHVGVGAAAAALVTAPVVVLLSGEQGLLQGEQRFTALAFVIALAGVARVVPAVAVLAAGGGSAAALVGVACGFTVAAFIAHFVAGTQSAAVPGKEVSDTGVAAVLRASQVQLVLIALISVDLLLSRVVLSPDDASIYALGAVATKAAFWLPAAVGVVLYPRMANPQQSAAASRLTLMVLAGLAVLTVGGAALVAQLVPVIVGEAYAPVEGILWAFAADGAFLAILQGALLAAIAGERTWLSVVAWAALAAEAALILALADTITEVLTIVVIGSAMACIAAWSAELWRARSAPPWPKEPLAQPQGGPTVSS
ncbi:polysaccharide biosynthesis protein [Aldersonia kunmingensis]|uniref:polysaccharide biosynthesis protein n=1 Tax=Aldersonia kunmingensis TaxID=408066 RepID=UPI000836C51D|nr:polysaccharide biosynthesis protein [Aldersonia kunmingensis]